MIEKNACEVLGATHPQKQNITIKFVSTWMSPTVNPSHVFFHFSKAQPCLCLSVRCKSVVCPVCLSSWPFKLSRVQRKKKNQCVSTHPMTRLNLTSCLAECDFPCHFSSWFLIPMTNKEGRRWRQSSLSLVDPKVLISCQYVCVHILCTNHTSVCTIPPWEAGGVVRESPHHRVKKTNRFPTRIHNMSFLLPPFS